VSRSAVDRFEQVTAKDRQTWRRWLAEHHATAPGVWLVIRKTASGEPGVSLEEATEEALCFGWIDSKMQPIDADRYRLVFTPRKPDSTWSKINKERVERLIRDGSMTEAGLAAIETAKANGSWTSLDAVEALSVPEDLAAALTEDPVAAANFDTYPASLKKMVLHWVTSAKRADTRSRRIVEIVQRAAANRRPFQSD
jgi:uncharacterized protein YdeI (YjbR/CyaY-like superfamily)